MEPIEEGRISSEESLSSEEALPVEESKAELRGRDIEIIKHFSETPVNRKTQEEFIKQVPVKSEGSHLEKQTKKLLSQHVPADSRLRRGTESAIPAIQVIQGLPKVPASRLVPEGSRLRRGTEQGEVPPLKGKEEVPSLHREEKIPPRKKIEELSEEKIPKPDWELPPTESRIRKNPFLKEQKGTGFRPIEFKSEELDGLKAFQSTQPPQPTQSPPKLKEPSELQPQDQSPPKLEGPSELQRKKGEGVDKKRERYIQNIQTKGEADPNLLRQAVIKKRVDEFLHTTDVPTKRRVELLEKHGRILGEMVESEQTFRHTLTTLASTFSYCVKMEENQEKKEQLEKFAECYEKGIKVTGTMVESFQKVQEGKITIFQLFAKDGPFNEYLKVMKELMEVRDEVLVACKGGDDETIKIALAIFQKMKEDVLSAFEGRIIDKLPDAVIESIQRLPRVELLIKDLMKVYQEGLGTDELMKNVIEKVNGDLKSIVGQFHEHIPEIEEKKLSELMVAAKDKENYYICRYGSALEVMSINDLRAECRTAEQLKKWCDGGRDLATNWAVTTMERMIERNEGKDKKCKFMLNFSLTIKKTAVFKPKKTMVSTESKEPTPTEPKKTEAKGRKMTIIPPQ